MNEKPRRAQAGRDDVFWVLRCGGQCPQVRSNTASQFL